MNFRKKKQMYNEKWQYNTIQYNTSNTSNTCNTGKGEKKECMKKGK